MDPALTVTFWFTIGMIMYVLPKLSSLADVKVFFAVLVGSFLISLVPGKREREYNLHNHLQLYFVVAMGATFVALRDKIIPRVNEHIVACNTVILSYALIHMIPIDLAIPIAIAAIIPTAAVFYSIFERNELDHAMQIFLYFWNDVMFLILFAVQYNAFTKLFPSFDTWGGIEPLQIIMAGMMFATVALPVMGLCYLIPVTSKHQSIEERLAQIRAYLVRIIHNFTEENTSPGKVLFVTIITWGLLTLNRIYPTFSDFNIITILIIGMPLIIRPAKPEVPPARIVTAVVSDAPKSE